MSVFSPCFFRVVDRLEERNLQAIDLVAELRQHGDEQRVRDEDRRQDAERAADPELRDEVEAEERETGDGDRDGETGEDHRSPRRRARLGRRVARWQTLVEVLAEPRDDEQRVVDADADPDHRHEDRRDRVDARQPGEDEEQDERRSDGDERERDRDGGRDERPEDEQQDDERGEEAEQLLRALLDRRELGVAVELGGDARRLDGLANSVLHGDDPRSVRRLDDVRELRLRVGDAPVVGEGLLGERVADAVDADLVPARGELRRLELRDRVLDRGLALGRVEPLALGSREDEVEHRALLGGELRLDQVGRALRVRARDLELVLQAPADGRDEQDEHGDDRPPSRERPSTGGWRTSASSARGRRSTAVRVLRDGRCCSDMLKPPGSRWGYDRLASRNSSVHGTRQLTRHDSGVRRLRPLSSWRVQTSIRRCPSLAARGRLRHSRPDLAAPTFPGCAIASARSSTQSSEIVVCDVGGVEPGCRDGRRSRAPAAGGLPTRLQGQRCGTHRSRCSSSSSSWASRTCSSERRTGLERKAEAREQRARRRGRR